MKIVVVGGYAPSLINFRGPLLEDLVRTGHDVVACAPDASNELRRDLRAMNVRYLNLSFARAGINPIGDLRTVRSFLRLYRQESPNLVLAYTAKPVIYGALAARLYRQSAFYGMITGLGYAFGTESFGQKVVGSVVQSMYRVALRSATGVIFQNEDDEREFQRRRLLRSGTPAYRVAGSGVDLEKFRPVPLPDEPVFLMVARLLADKGVREYLEAAKVVRQRYPAARFLLVGGLDHNPMSVSENELRSWVESGVVEYIGELDDVREAIAMSRIYVLPSYREGTPRTVLESMAMGRPVITTDAPGCRETVVPGQNGFLVPVKNVSALVSAMETMITDSGLAVTMGAQSVRVVQTKFDVRTVNRDIFTHVGLEWEDSRLREI